jgi:hypothetical protein
MFEPWRKEVAGGCRGLHGEDFRSLCSSPGVVRVIKSGRMGWAVHVARMGELRIAYCVSVGKPEGKRPLGGRGRGLWIVYGILYRHWVRLYIYKEIERD